MGRWSNWNTSEFSVLEGLVIETITGLEEGSDLVNIKTTCGKTFRMHHYQDCCECVDIQDINGDVEDLIGSTITRAEERESCGDDATYESGTWTFYQLDSTQGSVFIRWLGESNGYYSEGVSFEEYVPIQ